MANPRQIGRRQFLRMTAATGLALALDPAVEAQPNRMPRRPIPATGEALPVIGLGTSDEFESIPPEGPARLMAVVTTLLDHGGTLIDTAPGYGNAESILGDFLTELGVLDEVFVSTKVKQIGFERGRASMERSAMRLRKQPLDLMMVHSLEDVHTQVANLADWKASAHVRYIGVTTYRASGYDVVESLIKAGGLDFIQVDYSPQQPLAEERLIPTAVDHGVAIMINSAFGNGGYFRRLKDRPLPAWARELDCTSWAQFSLKFILGNPDVTTVLAATSDPEHMQDNALAAFGALPDASQRRRMRELIASI